MKKLPLANRKSERELFARIVEGQIAKRILLIEAASGMGKTDLLAQLARECPRDVLFASVDLKAAQTGVAYVFWRVREGIGHERFPRFAAEVEHLLRGASVNVAENLVLGQQQIQVALGGDEQTRAFRLTALQDVFFQDLRAIQQTIVIAFDTFNAAISELENWIGGGFLAAATLTPNLLVVVAGQRVPQPTIEWMDHYEHRRLGGIRSADDWYECAQAAGLKFDEQEIKTLCWYLDGHPLQMMSAFSRRAEEMGL